jgi:peroxiredoxin family protein
VGIFFTFYGLDILHKDRIHNLKVGPLGNPAMPPPIRALPFLKVPNLVGALPGMTAVATTMMKSWMGNADVQSMYKKYNEDDSQVEVSDSIEAARGEDPSRQTRQPAVPIDPSRQTTPAPRLRNSGRS